MKIVLIGDSGSGKTSLIGRYIDCQFQNQFISTIGVDFKVKRLTIGNDIVELQIFDTAGQERYRSIVSSYYRSANSVVIVFDITSRDSFESISYWISQVEQNSEPNMLKFLIGTKCDLVDKRAVSREECDDMAKHCGCKYYETSALQDENIVEAFLDIAKETKKVAKRNDKTDKKMPINSATKDSNDSCC